MAKILLIDDDADLTRFLQLNLEQHGHRVQCLERAERGPEILGQAEFDLVLLDNKMPGMSGIEFLAALQQRGLGVPVILMTGHATTNTAIQAMNLGAFDYVIKPLELDQLVDELGPLIAKALEMARPLKDAGRTSPCWRSIFSAGRRRTPGTRHLRCTRAAGKNCGAIPGRATSGSCRT